MEHVHLDYGHGDDALIPDTPFDEWLVQVEVLIEEWQTYASGAMVAADGGSGR